MTVCGKRTGDIDRARHRGISYGRMANESRWMGAYTQTLDAGLHTVQRQVSDLSE